MYQIASVFSKVLQSRRITHSIFVQYLHKNCPIKSHKAVKMLLKGIIYSFCHKICAVATRITKTFRENFCKIKQQI